MSLSEDLSSALKEAMKSKDKPKLEAIRQIQTEVAKKKAEKGEELIFYSSLILYILNNLKIQLEEFSFPLQLIRHGNLQGLPLGVLGKLYFLYLLKNKSLE